ncbi:MAG: hypothetical protein WCD49_08935 [Candidatus Acidiferrales bacterium]
MIEAQASNQQQANQSGAGTSASHERCPCYEVMDFIRTRLGVSPAVRQHLSNSRVEFLKAIREVIDEKIEHLSKTGQQGTKIPVE